MNESEPEKDSLLLTVLYMVLFYFIFAVAGYVLIALGVIQVVVRVLSGSPNAELQRFGASFGRYLGQIVHYIAMHTDTKPYPFSTWPQPDDQRDTP